MRTAILCFITAATFLGGTANPAHAEIQWESSLRKAHTRAGQENKLILLHFIRDNCVYCDKLEAGAFRAAGVSEAVSQNFVPLKINVSESKSNKKLAEMFKVDRFPMDVIVTTNGQALAHGVSPQDPSRYVAMLTKTLPATAPASPSPQATPGPAAPQQQIAAAAEPRPQPQTPRQQPGPMPRQIASASAPAPTPAPAAAPVSRQPASPTQVKNQLVSAKTHQNNIDMSLSMPGNPVDAAPSPTSTTPSASGDPKLAMDGFCAVSVVSESRWVEGKPNFGVVHLGKLYLFVNEAAMKTFLADPIPYTPVLNEIDVVRFFEERKIVPGKREWAMQDPSNKRMFFFADESAMMHFENEYARYVDAAIEVMDKAVKESNPGT